MKLNKSVCIAIFVALTLGTFKAGAALPESSLLAAPVAYHFETLNFSLIASRQGSNVVISPVVSMTNIRNSKINNLGLLNFLATAFHTNWPKGAQPALDLDSGDIFVVNKSGTNPVFNVSLGIDDGGTNVVFFTFAANPTVFSAKANAKGHFVLRETFYGKVFFHLFSEQNGITNTDLYFDGLGTTDFAETTTGVITRNDEASVAGDGTFMDGTWMVVSGQVTGSGKWSLPPTPPPVLPGEPW